MGYFLHDICHIDHHEGQRMKLSLDIVWSYLRGSFWPARKGKCHSNAPERDALQDNQRSLHIRIRVSAIMVRSINF